MENQNNFETENGTENETGKEMQAEPRRKHLATRLLIGAAAGLLASGLGFVIPLIGSLSIVFVFLSVFTGLVVYGSCDKEGLAAYIVVLEAGYALLGGVILAACMLLAVALPLALMTVLEMRRVAFFKRLYLSLAFELLGMVAALGLIVLIYRENLGDLAARTLKTSFEQLSSGLKDALASYYKQLYTAMGVALKYDTGDELLAAVAYTIGEYIKEGMPAMLLTFASINVLPGVKFSSDMRVKRNLPGAESKPLSEWRMSEQFIFGIILILVSALIFNFTLGAKGEVILNTALTLSFIACFIQTLASLSDRFGKAPISRGFKIVMFVIFILFLAQASLYYGLLSMLIGSHGIITLWRKRRGSNPTNQDDPF